MSTKKAKAPVKAKKSGTDDLHKPSKMKPIKGKKKGWDDDDEESIDAPMMDEDFKGFDDFDNDDDDDEDF